MNFFKMWFFDALLFEFYIQKITIFKALFKKDATSNLQNNLMKMKFNVCLSEGIFELKKTKNMPH